MSSIKMPFHHEDMVILINQAFGKKEPTNDEEMKAAAKSQFGIIKSEYEEISQAIDLHDTDKLRDALADFKVTLFGYPYLVAGVRITDRIVMSMQDRFFVDQNTSLTEVASIAIMNSRLHSEAKPGTRRTLIQDIETDEQWAALQETIDRSLASEMTGLERNTRKGKYEDAINNVINLVMTAYRIESSFGIPTDSDFEEVCSKLLTRLCSSEEVAAATIKKYADEKGIETHYEESPSIPGMFAVRSSKDQTSLDGEHFPANKFLKSIEFAEPVFKELPVKTNFTQAEPEVQEPDDLQAKLFEDYTPEYPGHEEETRG